jgi:hypothetical protein
MFRAGCALLLALTIAGCTGGGSGRPEAPAGPVVPSTATPTPTASAAASATPTPAASPTASASAAASASPTASAAATASPTASATPTPAASTCPASAPTGQTTTTAGGTFQLATFGGYCGTVAYGPNNDSNGGPAFSYKESTSGSQVGAPANPSGAVFFVSISRTDTTTGGSVVFTQAAASGTFTSTSITTAHTYSVSTYQGTTLLGTQSGLTSANGTVTYTTPFSNYTMNDGVTDYIILIQS